MHDFREGRCPPDIVLVPQYRVIAVDNNAHEVLILSS